MYCKIIQKVRTMKPQTKSSFITLPRSKFKTPTPI